MTTNKEVAVAEMPGGANLTATESLENARLEAPVTWKTYMMCVFAAFGGIFFGYDSGYINGVLGMDYFIETFEGLVCQLLLYFNCPFTNTKTGQSHYSR